AREVRRDARWLPSHGRALPPNATRAQPACIAGPTGCLVRKLLRRADGRGSALRPVPAPVPGLPPAADDGIEWQARDAGRRGGGVGNRSRLVGRARDQRPAFLLPTDPPGNEAHPV